MHQVLQSARLLELVGVLSVENLKQDLLHVRLIGLILHYLTELNSIDLGRHKPLYFVKKALLLRKDRLERCGYLRCEQDLVNCFAATVKVKIVLIIL